MQADIDTADLHGLAYECLAGCGFCCTFTPEVDAAERAALEVRFPRLPVVEAADGERSHIAFQGGCGACTLLDRRACSAYELRPKHCRHFPFHVHFGRLATALVNRSCRGVAAQAGGDLQVAFARDVLAVADGAALDAGAQQGREVFAQFDANCADADAAADAVQVARATVAGDVSWSGLQKIAKGIGVPFDALWQSILEPLAFEDVVARPFYLAADLKWFTFESKGKDLWLLEMDERGCLAKMKPLRRPKIGSGLDEAALRRVVSFFIERTPFEGQVAWLVDDTDYQLPVADAARLRMLELCLEAQWRAQVLWQLGVQPERMEEEVERFLDGAYLDAPTIAGWL